MTKHNVDLETDRYYKDSETERYYITRKEKLNLQNRYSMRVYWGYFSGMILSLLAFLTLQHFYFRNLYEDEGATPLSLLQIFCVFYTIIILIFVFNWLLRKKESNYSEKKVDFLSMETLKLLTIISFTCVIPCIVWIILVRFKNGNLIPIYNTDKNFIFLILKYFNTQKESLDLELIKICAKIFYIISQLMINILIMLSMIIFIYIPRRLRKEISNEDVRKHKYLYWVFFIKSTMKRDPKFFIGLVIFFLLSIIPGFIHIEGSYILYKEIFKFLGFISFWATSLLFVITPLITNLSELGSTFEYLSIRNIKDEIIPKLKDHTVIIGTGNLGSLLLKGSFFDMHKEGYGTKSICYPKNIFSNTKPKYLTDYHILIDKNFDLSIVSRKIIVIDKDDSKFKSVYYENNDFPVGIISPGSKNPKVAGVVIIGICGDAKDIYVLNAARIAFSKILVNTNPDPSISLELAKLAKLGKPEKQILCISNTPSFDVLSIFTYDNPVYLIDTQHIEGISISQRIIMWVIKYLKMNDIYSGKEFSRSELFLSLSEFRNQESWKRKYRKLDELSNDDGAEKSFEEFILKKLPIVTIVGNGRVIAHTIQSLISSLHEIYKDLNPISIRRLIKKIILTKLVVISDDKYIASETLYKQENIEEKDKKNKIFNFDNENRKYGHWSFYPLRNSEMRIPGNASRETDLYKIPVYNVNPSNFENIIEILSIEKPNLIVVVSENRYDTISIVNRISNALSSCKSIVELTKNHPHILSYVHKDDKLYMNDQIKKHFTYNLNRCDISGFPSQMTKESRLTREYVTSNQFVAMIRSLLSIMPEGELTFSFPEKPAELAKTLMKLSAMDMKMDISNIKNVQPVRIPSFIFSYSFEDRRYKDSFIFTGTAKLEEYSDYQSDENFCFLNCSHSDRTDILKMLKNNLNYSNLSQTKYNSIVDKIRPRPLRDNIISTIERHKSSHYNTIYNPETARLFTYNTKNTNSKKECSYDHKNISINKNISKKENVLNSIPDMSHFKIWGEGTYPGTLAEALANTALAVVDKERYFNKVKFVPNINFCVDYTYPVFKNADNGKEYPENEELQQWGQESVYIRLWDEQKFCNENKNKNSADDWGRNTESRIECFEKGVIRAVKIKKGGSFYTKEVNGKLKIFEYSFPKRQGWLGYAKLLTSHLNQQYTRLKDIYHYEESYSLYLIKKVYTEGEELYNKCFDISINELTEVLELSDYYKINLENDEIELEYQVIRKIKPNNKDYPDFPQESQIETPYNRYNSIQDLKDKHNFYSMKKDDSSSPYELVVIRKDIVEVAIKTSPCVKKEIFKNMLYFIDDL